MLGAGLRPATVSRSRRRDGGDGAKVAWPQRASGDGHGQPRAAAGCLCRLTTCTYVGGPEPHGQFRLKCEPHTDRVYSDHPRTQELR